MAKGLFADATTIANGATVSATVSFERNRVPLAVIMPAAFTGTSITFQVSFDGSTFQPLYNESTLYSITVSTSVARTYALSRQAMDGVKHLRVVSQASEGAIRTLSIVSGE